MQPVEMVMCLHNINTSLNHLYAISLPPSHSYFHSLFLFRRETTSIYAKCVQIIFTTLLRNDGVCTPYIFLDCIFHPFALFRERKEEKRASNKKNIINFIPLLRIYPTFSRTLAQFYKLIIEWMAQNTVRLSEWASVVCIFRRALNKHLIWDFSKKLIFLYQFFVELCIRNFG